MDHLLRCRSCARCLQYTDKRSYHAPCLGESYNLWDANTVWKTTQQPGDREEMFANCPSDNRFVYKQLAQVNTTAKANLIKKQAEDLHRCLSEDETHMASEHMKDAGRPWSFGKCASNPRGDPRLTPIRMATSKTAENRRQQGRGEAGALVRCWWERKIRAI